MNNPKVKKAVILTAGLGTRFLPATKSIPKAMLPILDKPVIQYLVEEALNSGISDIIIVGGRGIHLIEDHLTRSHELEYELKERNKEHLLETVRPIEQANYAFTRQKEAKGDGHAILCAKDLIGKEPFAVLFGDDIVDHETPALAQLMEVYQATGTPVIATQKVPKNRISSYGVLDPELTDSFIKVKGLVEKPAPNDAPSDFGIVGKYVCTADVLSHLEATTQAGNELRLIDGFRSMLESGLDLHAKELEGERFDTGNKAGLLAASLHFSKKDPEFQD